jgi:signal transduction histidine kinase
MGPGPPEVRRRAWYRTTEMPTDHPDPPGPDSRERAQQELAHALRTPLTSIALGVGLLQEGTLGPLGERQRDVVRSLAAEVERLLLLVDNALHTEHLGAYAGPVERVPVDLGDLVRRASLPIAEQGRPRSIEVVSTLPPGVVVIGDPSKLAWVAASLMGNALRFSPASAAIEVTLTPGGDEAELAVRDHGPGIAPDLSARIFDREGGPGLTLSLVREIVEAHGGRVGVSSEVGQGSVFRVVLPLWRKRPAGGGGAGS